MSPGNQETTDLHVAGLKELAQRPLFDHWEGVEPPEMPEASRRLIRHAIHQLIELGPVVPSETVLAVLRDCIEGFNRLDADERRGVWIETATREDICMEVDRIIACTGLQDREELQDGTVWREW